MARIRTIKPEFWKHEDLSGLPEATHILAAALLNHADDEGYFNANPGLVRAECSPLREPSVSIQDSLTKLSNVGYIKLGDGSDGKRYGLIVKFDEHQRVNRPTPSKIKAVGIVWDDSVSTHPQLTEDSPPERKGKERNREGANAPPAEQKPDEQEKPTKEPQFLLPEWINQASWQAFEEMRNKLRKPMTVKAKGMIVTELIKLRSAGSDPNAILDQSTRNSWQDVYALKDRGGLQRQPDSGGSPASRRKL